MMVNAVQPINAVNQNDTGNATNSANGTNNIATNATSSAGKSTFPEDSVTISDSAVQAQTNTNPAANQ